MQFSIFINQVAAVEWGLNLNQAAIFGFIYEAATWAAKDGDYWNVSKSKIIQEFPLLTDKPDTIYRLVKVLVDKGVLEKRLIDNKDFYRVTEKGLDWNRIATNPTLGKKSDPRKKIRKTSEKNPSKVGKKSDVSNNQLSNNQLSDSSVTKVTADGDTNDAKTLSEMDALQSADYWIAKMDGSDKWAFDCAIALMGLTETDKAIHSFIAGSIKQYGVGLVTEGLLQCIIEQPYNAKDYLAGILHRHKSRTSLSLDWQPATAQVNSLRSKGLTDESIRWALAVFVIWMREREIMHHDWPLAFENWCDREIGYENAQKKADLQRMASRAGITIDPSAIAINEGVGC